MQRIVQRAVRHASIHHLRNVRDHNDAVKQQTSNYWLGHKVDYFTRASPREYEIVKPERSCNQHEWWHEV